MFSLKKMSMRPRSTLTSPGIGVERMNSGAFSSRGPPSGRPMEAQAATASATAAIISHLIQRILRILNSIPNNTVSALEAGRWGLKQYPGAESNCYLMFRKHLFYPLNYQGMPFPRQVQS